MILNLLRKLGNQIESNIQSREEELTSQRQLLTEKKSNFTERKSEAETQISKAETKRDQAKGGVDETKEELEVLSSQEEEFADEKERHQSQISLINRIKRLIVGQENGIFGDSCIEKDCHEGLACDPELRVCRQKDGDSCHNNDHCLSDAYCVEGKCGIPRMPDPMQKTPGFRVDSQGEPI
eukprot:gb/GECH01011299.1/.p1 GENE.gb/GECH01011299.1/~~gb/GECH01011299.1/.p1  ORF type:complete len:181 (+),score=28.92 gb/GECH01011299.1/:1-543(+)